MTRKWKEIDKAAIIQGVYLIDPRFIDVWEAEVFALNEGKVGQPYEYPTSLFEYAAIFHAQGFGYRTIEGMLQKISALSTGFKVPVYSQIRKRILRLSLEFSSEGSNLEVAVDGSGMKPATRGDWIRHKWKVKRGWIKVVALGDVRGRVLDVVVGDECLNEIQAARDLLEAHAAKISVVYMDGLHDTYETFETCKRLKIQPVIKVRKNACAAGICPRSKAVKHYQSMQHKDWVRQTGYGRRWLASEGIFSSEKRTFGESVMAKTVENQLFEVRMKFWAHQRMWKIAHEG